MSSYNILSIDTSTEACSAALLYNNIIYKKFILSPQKHTHNILPIIDFLLQKKNIFINNLDLLSFCYGPGTFTGIKISINIIKSFSFAYNIPIVVISSLKILAYEAFKLTNIHKILVSINSRKNSIYWGKYIIKNTDCFLTPQDTEEKEILLSSSLLEEEVCNLQGKWITVGTGWKNFPTMKNRILSINQDIQLISSNILYPHAINILPLASILYKNKYFCNFYNIPQHSLYNNIIWKKNIITNFK